VWRVKNLPPTHPSETAWPVFIALLAAFLTVKILPNPPRQGFSSPWICLLTWRGLHLFDLT